eukprot:766751-Hanusia_phi.AAC.3
MAAHNIAAPAPLPPSAASDRMAKGQLSPLQQLQQLPNKFVELTTVRPGPGRAGPARGRCHTVPRSPSVKFMIIHRTTGCSRRRPELPRDGQLTQHRGRRAARPVIISGIIRVRVEKFKGDNILPEYPVVSLAVRRLSHIRSD